MEIKKRKPKIMDDDIMTELSIQKYGETGNVYEKAGPIIDWLFDYTYPFMIFEGEPLWLSKKMIQEITEWLEKTIKTNNPIQELDPELIVWGKNKEDIDIETHQHLLEEIKKIDKEEIDDYYITVYDID